jgi:methionyl-tRNA formyltransferase
MSHTTRRCVVFGYGDMGVRCLATLLSLGLDVALVVTHEDDPGETLWYDSVQDLAGWAGIPCIAPANPNTAAVIAQVADCAPAWIFSFYYRQMLGAELLATPTLGAYNLHGSLLPRYRGRAPTNWALLLGEVETGVSLHRMVLKPDAGGLVDSVAFPILPNDTALAVFRKQVCVAESLLLRTVPAMLEGRHQEQNMDLAAGSYFGRRRPEDGRIDWFQPAWAIHNLIRAVAPPFPGAYADLPGRRLRVLGSYWADIPAAAPGPRLVWEGGSCWLDGSDGRRLRLTRLAINDENLGREGFMRHFGATSIDLGGKAEWPT